MADINFNTVARATNFNAAADTLHITQGGTHKQLLLEDLINEAKNQSLTSMEAALLDKLTEGCYIFYHKVNTSIADDKGNPFAVRASKWKELENGGESATGILVLEGGLHRVIAPTESGTLKWGAGSALVNNACNRADALDDFNGKEKTAAILANAAYSEDGEDFVTGFVASYSRLNSDARGKGAGQWWIPSVGELFLLSKNIQKINMCISLIDDGVAISNNVLWACNEESAGLAYGVIPFDFKIKSYAKRPQYPYRVRPFTDFI